MLSILSRTALLLSAAAALRAQSIPGAVLAQQEPHHHLAYADSTLRVLRVRVDAHDTTLLHEHDPDYFWISLGASTIVNVKPGVPDATVTSPDLSFHYSFGNFAHVARNPGTKPFDNITVELLHPQTDVHNLCERALADKPLDCQSPPRSRIPFAGAGVYPALASAEMRVFLVTIAPGGKMRPLVSSRGTWIIALDSADAHSLTFTGSATWLGGTAKAPAGSAWTLTNRGKKSIRSIAVMEQR